MVVLGGVGLWWIARMLYESADDVLRSKAVAIEAGVEVGRTNVSWRESKPSTLTAGLDAVRIWDRARRPLYVQEGPYELPPVDPAVLDAVLGGQPEYETVRATDGTTIRLYTRPLRDSGRIEGVVQVARSQTEVEEVLAQLRLLGLGGILVALTFASAGGYFLACRALAPVDRIARTAEWINADDLSQRLGLRLPDDELGRLAAAFDNMIERLEDAFERQRRFTADASHELRSPLAVIRSQAEVALTRERTPAYYARVLTSIGEESERLGRLAESLLVLARADAGHPLELAPLDLDEVVAEAGTRVAPLAHEQGVELVVTAGEVGPVRGDATWLTQLLLNLLDNALRHTPPGGRVALCSEPGPGGAILKVADTGEGIASEHMSHLFERFYRVDRARARATGGAGLGLAICDWVTRAHRGRIEVASELGQGTTVSVWLPATTQARTSRATA